MRIASWALENLGEKIRYREIFADLFGRLKKSYYESQSSVILTIQQNILKLGSEEWKHLLSSEQTAVEETLKTLKVDYGYTETCAKEIVSYILSKQS